METKTKTLSRYQKIMDYVEHLAIEGRAEDAQANAIYILADRCRMMEKQLVENAETAGRQLVEWSLQMSRGAYVTPPVGHAVRDMEMDYALLRAKIEELLSVARLALKSYDYADLGKLLNAVDAATEETSACRHSYRRTNCSRCSAKAEVA